MLKFIELMHVDTKREQFNLMLINKYYVYNVCRAKGTTVKLRFFKIFY